MCKSVKHYWTLSLLAKHSYSPQRKRRLLFGSEQTGSIFAEWPTGMHKKLLLILNGNDETYYIHRRNGVNRGGPHYRSHLNIWCFFLFFFWGTLVWVVSVKNVTVDLTEYVEYFTCECYGSGLLSMARNFCCH